MSTSNTGRLPIIPRLLTRQQAAVYCGVSLPTFVGVCPVKAVALGSGKRLERFDRVSLDKWIDSLAKVQLTTGKDWLSELGSSDDRASN
jgi:hypothetical protein